MHRRGGALAVLLLLLAPLTLACGQLLHAQMLVWGDSVWPGYALARSGCVEEEPDEPETSAMSGQGDSDSAKKGGDKGAAGDDDDLLDDALDDGDDDAAEAKADKKAAAASEEDDLLDSALDDELGDDDEKPAEAPAAAKATPADTASAGDDELDDLDAALDEIAEPGEATSGSDPPAGDNAAAGEPPSDDGAAAAVASAAVPTKPVMTDGLRTFCRLERKLAKASETGIGWTPTVMVLLLLISAFITTLRRHHISLRNPRTALGDRISNGVQLIGNAFIGASSWHMRTLADGADKDRQVLWALGMGVLILINLGHIARPVRSDTDEKLSFGAALACVPLYAWMAVISGVYFLAVEGHPAGIAIYLNKITEFSILYIQVGLYLWTGMLLRDTRLGELMFDMLRPLKLPPDVFAVIVVVLAAVPTAYSGASGILVLALGATIYTELRRSGASQQRALAATAMSGSLGVVLPPCLLVVIVASINLDVTTDELFYWGWRVFVLTTFVFAAVSFVLRQSSWAFSPGRGAFSNSMAAGKRLVPYFGLAITVVAFFYFVLNAALDEHTAPYVLPVAMLIIMPWDKFTSRRAGKLLPRRPETSLDTGTHIGALLMLMGLSACLGGVIERAEIVEMFPHSVGSPLLAMAMLMVVLVLIGMVMDPYGAVILVSVTLYPIAKANGIHPLNFWMTALVSFELGYLTPPVALNHLLARQVVMHLPEYDELEEIPADASFVRRHERLIVPISVLTVTLLTVAFGPLLWGIRAG